MKKSEGIQMKIGLFTLGCVGYITMAGAVQAQQSFPTSRGATESQATNAPSDTLWANIRQQMPIVAYSYSAGGVPARTIGIQTYGLGLAAPGQDGVVGGGGSVWASPIERLTLVVDGRRTLSREFSPSAAGI